MDTRQNTTSFRILSAIADSAFVTGNLIRTILESPPGTPAKRMLQGAQQREDEYQKRKVILVERRKVDLCLSRLKKQGFIIQEQKKWFLTREGREKLRHLKKRSHIFYPVVSYPKEKSNEVVIVSFDIPEKEKHKRDWLRRQLRKLDFELLQKSVWTGKVKLPQEFLDTLKDLDLMLQVQILAVTKTGTIHKI